MSKILLTDTFMVLLLNPFFVLESQGETTHTNLLYMCVWGLCLGERDREREREFLRNSVCLCV